MFHFFTLIFCLSLNSALCRLITFISIKQCDIPSSLRHYPAHISIDIQHEFFHFTYRSKTSCKYQWWKFEDRNFVQQADVLMSWWLGMSAAADWRYDGNCLLWNWVLLFCLETAFECSSHWFIILVYVFVSVSQQRWLIWFWKCCFWIMYSEIRNRTLMFLWFIKHTKHAPSVQFFPDHAEDAVCGFVLALRSNIISDD